MSNCGIKRFDATADEIDIAKKKKLNCLPYICDPCPRPHSIHSLILVHSLSFANSPWFLYSTEAYAKLLLRLARICQRGKKPDKKPSFCDVFLPLSTRTEDIQKEKGEGIIYPRSSCVVSSYVQCCRVAYMFRNRNPLQYLTRSTFFAGNITFTCMHDADTPCTALSWGWQQPCGRRPFKSVGRRRHGRRWSERTPVQKNTPLSPSLMAPRDGEFLEVFKNSLHLLLNSLEQNAFVATPNERTCLGSFPPPPPRLSWRTNLFFRGLPSSLKLPPSSFKRRSPPPISGWGRRRKTISREEELLRESGGGMQCSEHLKRVG